LARFGVAAVLQSFPVAIAAMMARRAVQLTAQLVRPSKRERILSPADALDGFPSLSSDPMRELVESYESFIASPH
jgi:hypothetical protein